MPLLRNSGDNELFCELAQEVANAEIPAEIMSAIRLGRMTALRKPSGGVRGIVVGDVLRRLVARTVAQVLGNNFKAATAPHQYHSRNNYYISNSWEGPDCNCNAILILRWGHACNCNWKNNSVPHAHTRVYTITFSMDVIMKCDVFVFFSIDTITNQVRYRTRATWWRSRPAHNLQRSNGAGRPCHPRTPPKAAQPKAQHPQPAKKE